MSTWGEGSTVGAPEYRDPCHDLPHTSLSFSKSETHMRYTFILLASLLTAPVWAQTSVDFQELPLPGPNSAYYGQDNAGGFSSRGTFFNNQYTDFGGGFF